MTNHITNDRIVYAVDKPTPNVSGTIVPKFIVMHYTAGLTADSAIRTFESPASRVSAHLTIDVDGTVYQHAPFTAKTWHAGPSAHMGYTGLNNYAIGIEIVNAGWLNKGPQNYFRDGLTMPLATPVVEGKNARVGGGTYYWPAYPEKQLSSVIDVTKDLIEEYNILDIVSHEEIDTRGWKTDPGPAFPMERFKRLLLASPHRDLDVDRYEVTASELNTRTGPGTAFPSTSTIVRGTIVSVEQKNGDWCRIDSDHWVHGAYLRRVS